MQPQHIHYPDPSNHGKLWLPNNFADSETPFGARVDNPEEPSRLDPSTRHDKAIDPGLAVPGAPFNFGQEVLPHAATFTGVITSHSKVYRPSDEALRHSAANARFMRNDPMVMEPLELRQKSVAMLDWHIEPEDQSNEEQKRVAAELERIIKRTPRFMQYREVMLHANWYGRYAISNRWASRRIGGKMRYGISAWVPVHGDKLVFRYDDGSGDHRPGQVGIRVGANALSVADHRRFWEAASKKIEATDFGLAYFLDGWERSGLSIHKYMVEDGEWEEPYNAGRIHGVGIRSRIYWAWYQKQEALAMMLEYLERSAAGVEIWYYPMGNPQAEAKAKEAGARADDLGSQCDHRAAAGWRRCSLL